MAENSVRRRPVVEGEQLYGIVTLDTLDPDLKDDSGTS
ncbi:hypothetical protein OB919_05250 [Halobacteria archaeon AArc-curdl1]|uniref:CBS domain-containing protein n=1 Tax=Natronosalvus hydrolyticus TaxID=2979988 RepID=A0AAP3E6J1_9EURY|nr:hypothetical protein [Halobacteria archaeon AArc-curdl1]